MLVQIVQSNLMGTDDERNQATDTPDVCWPEHYLAISTHATTLSTAVLYDLQLNGTILKALLLADGNDEHQFELMKM